MSQLEGHLADRHGQVRSQSSHIPSEEDEDRFHRMLHNGDLHNVAGKPGQKHHHSSAGGTEDPGLRAGRALAVRNRRLRDWYDHWTRLHPEWPVAQRKRVARASLSNEMGHARS